MLQSQNGCGAAAKRTAAIDVLGPDAGLSAAVSGHDNYWLWGLPGDHGPVIGVGHVDLALRSICPTVEQVGVINLFGVENEEAGLSLYLCLGPSRQLADVWPEANHFD